MSDYIAREEAKTALNIEAEISTAAQKALEDAIDGIPAADMAPVVHGRWIEYTKVIIPEPYNKWEQAWKCSECGFNDGFVAYNFCPNCGARMDGEEP